MGRYRTVVVNIYGGPGAGKTTLAHDLTAGLSKAGVLAEFVPEYAKELAWAGRRDLLDGSAAHQRLVTGEQWRRIEVLLGRVEAIVIDSPIALGLVYADREDPGYAAFARETAARMTSCSNFNVFVRRRNEYDQRGRLHDEAESMLLDDEVLDILADRSLWAEGDGANPASIDRVYEHPSDEPGGSNILEVLGAAISAVAEAREAGREEAGWSR